MFICRRSRGHSSLPGDLSLLFQNQRPSPIVSFHLFFRPTRLIFRSTRLIFRSTRLTRLTRLTRSTRPMSKSTILMFTSTKLNQPSVQSIKGHPRMWEVSWPLLRLCLESLLLEILESLQVLLPWSPLMCQWCFLALHSLYPPWTLGPSTLPLYLHLVGRSPPPLCPSPHSTLLIR